MIIIEFMRNTFFSFLLSLLVIPFFLISCSERPQDKWSLVWSEEFNENSIDSLIWSKTPRNQSDWCNYMTDLDTCYEMRAGNLVLRGIESNSELDDTVPYLTGGIWSKKKKLFGNGRFEVRAKVDEAIGAWPAIWLLPEEENWPYAGEVDILEHLNYDSIVYQTVHTHYTYNLGEVKHPQAGVTHPFKNNEYNTYAVEMYPDSITFFVNDEHTFTYPRIDTELEGQFPFNDHSFYIVLSMQLGGAWVGEVDPAGLPVEMHIDWIRFYELNPDYTKK